MVPLAAPPRIELRLYVASPAPRSAHAIRSVQALCEEHFPERFDLEIVDVCRRPVGGGDLLDVSRIRRDAIALRREHVEVSAMVRRALDSTRPLLDAAGHSLQVLLSAEPLLVDVDPTRFEQILVNLLDNAARYTPRRGRIVVSAKQSGGQAVVHVRDDGVGIAPELLPHIFDLFGLTLVKSLVEMHGGTLEAHSAGVGHGAELVVRLPLASAAGADRPTRRT